MKNTEKKLLEFNENLNLKISELSSDDYSFEESLKTQLFKEHSFSEAIDKTERLILEGIADDLDLEIGLKIWPKSSILRPIITIHSLI